MDEGLRNFVWQRAGRRCEYCLIAQEGLDVFLLIAYRCTDEKDLEDLVVK